MYYLFMNKIYPTPDFFAPVENKIDRVCKRLGSNNRQYVLIRHLLKHVDGAMDSVIGAVLKEQGLNNVSFTALVMLYSTQHDSINPSHLSDVTGESRANVTRICDDLVAKGLLQRAPSEVDRRRVDLKIAPAGEEMMERLLPLMSAQMSKAMSCFDEQECQQLENLLKRLLESLHVMNR